MGFLFDEFGCEQVGQQAMDGAPSHQLLGRQVAVHGVSNLIDVVADAPQLGEQRRVHRLVGRPGVHLDLAFEHKPFAKS